MELRHISDWFSKREEPQTHILPCACGSNHKEHPHGLSEF